MEPVVTRVTARAGSEGKCVVYASSLKKIGGDKEKRARDAVDVFA